MYCAVLSHLVQFNSLQPHDCSLPANKEAQEYQSRQPIHSPGDLPDLGIEPRVTTLKVDSLLDELPGKHPLPRVTLCPSNYTKYVTMRNKNMLTHKQVHSNVIYQFSSIQSLSYVQLFVTPWTATCQPSLSIANSRSLLIFLSIEPSNHLIFCHPFFCLQS